MAGIIRPFACVLVAGMLTGCATQPEWLVRKRLYPQWEVSNRSVNQYSFDWSLSGDPEIAPLQVFSTGNEIWLQFEPEAAIPAIFAVQAKGEKPLPYYRNDPYIIIKGNWAELSLRAGNRVVRARHWQENNIQ
ncbi:MAG: TrbG/VirB9 family P-type conjugative transfer protein [Advenella sp.]|jgi:type IV secretory pathway VirB9-like protein|nr:MULTISPECIES: TrbG/VirB9 family P-type conjugative transfer protein [Advenella]MDD3758933.1 TrbG/VirB9 family P-type conjugative transfer protein [Advenella sp.]WKU18488.1 TrbG/VirB9 family P-type conjugative transfer protein [Advenella alkanexedens]